MVATRLLGLSFGPQAPNSLALVKPTAANFSVSEPLGASPARTIVVATRNRHKTDEIRQILGSRFRCLTLDDFPGVPPVKEDAATFAGNATKKAVEIARWLKTSASPIGDGAFVLADDSGLEVEALNGAPGVYSARFAALDSSADGNTPDADNNAKLLRLLKDVPKEKRTARFRCVIALLPVESDSGDMTATCFEGACEGRIDTAPRGTCGFGYDPLFVPTGFDRSFAELGEAEKNQISHRARALAKLQAHWANLI